MNLDFRRLEARQYREFSNQRKPPLARLPLPFLQLEFATRKIAIRYPVCLLLPGS